MPRQESSARRMNTISRRTAIKALGAGAGVAAAAPRVAFAQAAAPVAPPSTVTTPPRDFSRNGAPTTYFTDPDILTIDPLFNQYAQPNSAITRLWTGACWMEGPAGKPRARHLACG